MKVSIITVSYNSENTIEDTIQSVLGQSYSDIEYIIVDGASEDGTMEVVREYKNKVDKVVSKPDKGLYHAMNKGIRMATGDIVGTLNSDDFYASDEVVKKVVNKIKGTGADCV